MPVLGGIAAAHAIHAECPALRVSALSVAENPAEAEARWQAGAAGYVWTNNAAEVRLAVVRGGGSPPA